MKKRYRLNEDKLLPKLPVVFSIEFSQIIEDMKFHNPNNTNALLQFREYLDGIVNYISNPVIAWDNMNRFQHFPNGSTNIREFGYDVTFMIKTNTRTNQSYVYIYNMNLNTEKFGLKQPSLYENKHRSTCNHKKVIRLTESELYSMVQECVIKVLNKRASFLNENKESRALKRARKAVIKYANLKDDADAYDIINGIRTEIPNSRLCNCKYISGIVRLIYRDAVSSQQFEMMNHLLEAIASDLQCEKKYDDDFNGKSLDELKKDLQPTLNAIAQKEKYELSKGKFINNNDYQVVHIPDLSVAHHYSQWTSWCITDGYQPTFDNYLGHGETLYFCLKNGYQHIPKPQSFDHYHDEYGSSMIAVAVYPSGRMAFSASRWNDTGVGNKSYTPLQISQLIGKNFFDVFLPR